MSPQEIKAWLKQTKRDRKWLADQCSVSKPTVDGWLSENLTQKRGIPRHQQNIIAGLMYKEEPVAPMFTLDQFAKIQQGAQAMGVGIQEFVEQAVREKIERLPSLLTKAE